MKKIISLFMSAIMTAAVLAGCGNTEAETPRSDEEMPGMTSMELVKDMGIGWNLGDTLDVCQADRDGDGVINEHVAEGEKVDETLWGNPKATRELFAALKEDGISSVRIPVTWRDHMDEAGNVDADWMARVKEVVDYAYDQDMYVILNVHHDGGGDPDFGAWIIEGAINDKDATLARYKNLWTQIADEFKDYGDKLLFESMNEVGFDRLGEDGAFAMLNEFNRTFVDLVRSSGGNNPQRHLLIAGYWTDIQKSCDSRFKMPDDPAGRCILSVHYYTPWEFCTTNIHNTWGTPQEISQMQSLYGMLKTNFIDKGIPVIVGEYAASGDDKDSCVLFIKTMTGLCGEYGIAPFYWDNGGQVDRTTYEWRDPEFLQAMKDGYYGE